MKLKQLILSLIACTICTVSNAQQSYNVDLCIYAGNSAGVIAAYTAAKMGKKVLLVEPGKHLGGLSSGGLGYTDIGNKYAITGLSRDFYRRVGKHYGRFETWIFEPHVAEAVFREYIRLGNVQVLYDLELVSLVKEGLVIRSAGFAKTGDATGKGTTVISAKQFIDCSYEGDLMAKAGVSYTVGREANSTYGETYNGVQLMDKHQFPDGIDPWKTPGDKNSGLVWGISDAALAATGSGDKKVQAYNFRICLTDSVENLIPITQPADYDPARYELLLRYLAKKTPGDLWGFLKFDLMPNHKTDINNNGPISTDMIGMNYEYPEASPAKRKEIITNLENYTKGLLYFAGHDPRMPEHLRTQMLKWGYPKDEYTDNGGWSTQAYIRETRRMVGMYVMSQANCEGKEVVDDEAGMAAYTMDSHNCQRVVVNGMVKNEGNVEIGGFGPYPISYRSLVPRKEECSNLLVPVCLSASHIAYGSIRMEPVFMVLAQSSAVAACLAIDNKTAIQSVDVKKMQSILKADPLADKSIAEILVDNDNPASVTRTGEWTRLTKGTYGPSAYQSSGSGTVKFTPLVKTGSAYHVYTYLPKTTGLAKEMKVLVSDGKKTITKTIRPDDIKVQGQTSGEWVDLGTYKLTKGKSASVTITSGDSGGTVVADAVLFIAE